MYLWEDVSQFLVSVWNCVRRDVVADPTSAVAKAALATLSRLTRLIYSSPAPLTAEHNAIVSTALQGKL